jgi:hypothetical protein
MHRVIFSAVLGLLMLAAWGLAAPDPWSGPPERKPIPAPCFGLRVTYVAEGRVFAISEETLTPYSAIRLWEAGIPDTEGDGSRGRSRTFRQWHYSPSLSILHWRLAYDHFWTECGFQGLSVSHKIPQADLPLLDTANEDRGKAELVKKYGDREADSADWWTIILMEPCSDTISELTQGRDVGRPGFHLDLQCDFLPTGKTTWDLYLLHESRLYLMHCAEGPRKEGFLTTTGVRTKEIIDAGFQEPFLTYGKPESPFFVTKSGKVFQCLRPDKKEPRMVKVWTDGTRPVNTILNDVDTNRTFVAGLDLAEGPGKWFYFELTDRPEKKPFDRSALDSIKAEEPLKSSLVFARFLVKEGKIKDKPK